MFRHQLKKKQESHALRRIVLDDVLDIPGCGDQLIASFAMTTHKYTVRKKNVYAGGKEEKQ